MRAPLPRRRRASSPGTRRLRPVRAPGHLDLRGHAVASTVTCWRRGAAELEGILRAPGRVAAATGRSASSASSCACQSMCMTPKPTALGSPPARRQRSQLARDQARVHLRRGERRMRWRAHAGTRRWSWGRRRSVSSSACGEPARWPWRDRGRRRSAWRSWSRRRARSPSPSPRPQSTRRPSSSGVSKAAIGPVDGRKPLAGSSAHSRASMAWPDILICGLRQRQRLAGGDAQLPLHQIEAGDRLGHRMLDLQARVHLDEVPGRLGRRALPPSTRNSTVPAPS